MGRRKRSGAVSSPLVSSAVHAKHGSAPLCAAWLRHDAKMLVTPRAPDAIWGMAADKTFALRGAAKAASATSKEKGPTRPAPRLNPTGAKRREAHLFALEPDRFTWKRLVRPSET